MALVVLDVLEPKAEHGIGDRQGKEKKKGRQ
jgi:hypothetical protein